MRLFTTLVSAVLLGSVHSLAAAVEEPTVDLAARDAEAFAEIDELMLEARGPHDAKVSLPRGWNVVSACTADGGKQRVFPEKQSSPLSLVRHVLLDNSPQKCAARCAQDSYPFAAVRMGVECWCSRQQPKIIAKNKNQCTYPCPGNPKLTCGSFSTSQVYVNWSLTHKKAPRVGTPRLASGWSRALDCVVDPTVGEKFLKGTDVFELKNNSPLACTTLCGKKGYALAGVEYSNECMCGNDWKGPKPASRPKKECYMACTGDKTLTCGAGHRVTFFKHGRFRRFNSTVERDFDEPNYD